MQLEHKMAVNLTEEQKRLLEQQQQTIKDQQLPIAPVAPPNVNSITGQPTMLRNAFNSIYGAASGVATPIINAGVNGFSNAVNYVDRSFPEIRQYAGAAASGADQFIPSTTAITPPVIGAPVAPATPPVAITPMVTPPAAPTPLRMPGQDGSYNYDVTTSPGTVRFENALSNGSISGLTPEQVARVSAGLREGNRNMNVVPSSFFTGGATQAPETPVQRRLTDAEVAQQYERSRLEDVLNQPFSATSMSPGELVGAIVNRRAAQRRYDQITKADEARNLAGDQFGYQSALQAQQIAGNADVAQQRSVAEQQKSALEFQRSLALEQLKLSQPDWKADTTKVVDANGVEGTVTTMSDSKGRSYQVPDANDLAALKALPNDNARIQMLRRVGIPDEHIPRYLQGLQ